MDVEDRVDQCADSKEELDHSELHQLRIELVHKVDEVDESEQGIGTIRYVPQGYKDVRDWISQSEYRGGETG